MKLVFFGTPYYSVYVLEKIHKKFKDRLGNSPFQCVVTQKPKPFGRNKVLKYSAVDEWAHKKGVKILFDPREVIKEFPKMDLGILASYGEIIPESVISNFKYGILNVHPSLLPQFRGASPVQATILSNSTPGVSIIKMDTQLDHGEIVSQFKDSSEIQDDSQSLRDRLFSRSAEVMESLIPAYIDGKIKLKKQDHTAASFTKQIQKNDSFIPPHFLINALNGSKSNDLWEIGFIKDFSIKPAPETIDRFIRAMSPWPLAWTQIMPSGNDSKRLKLFKSHIENEKLVIDQVQLEGKKPVSWEQFVSGYPRFKFDKSYKP